MLGQEQVGIVPQGVFPQYCSSWFPGENINEFMNLSYERADEEIAWAEWLLLRKAWLHRDIKEYG